MFLGINLNPLNIVKNKELLLPEVFVILSLTKRLNKIITNIYKTNKTHQTLRIGLSWFLGRYCFYTPFLIFLCGNFLLYLLAGYVRQRCAVVLACSIVMLTRLPFSSIYIFSDIFLVSFTRFSVNSTKAVSGSLNYFIFIIYTSLKSLSKKTL